ncbi:MAG: hypothetical protein HPY45_16810 [Anaerolineae bacterium]|nr:hypothetical protein [Anaerolineae bacterium]
MWKTVLRCELVNLQTLQKIEAWLAWCKTHHVPYRERVHRPPYVLSGVFELEVSLEEYEKARRIELPPGNIET